MTKTQFFTAQILSKLGFPRTQKRLLDAADELHLLKEAQEVLGQNVWSKLRDLPQYKDVISDIEQLLEEKERLSEHAETLKDEVENLRNQQNNQFSISESSNTDTLEQFKRQQSHVALLKSELATIKSKALEIRREHDEAKSYLDDIKAAGETDSNLISSQENQIASHKQSFATLKEEKNKLDLQLVKATTEFEKISEIIEDSNNSQQDSTVKKFRELGEKNKEISGILSRVGIIDNKISSHYSELGKHISLDSLTNAQSRKLIKEHFGLCKIIEALRKSIGYNHILGGRA